MHLAEVKQHVAKSDTATVTVLSILFSASCSIHQSSFPCKSKVSRLVHWRNSFVGTRFRLLNDRLRYCTSSKLWKITSGRDSILLCCSSSTWSLVRFWNVLKCRVERLLFDKIRTNKFPIASNALASILRIRLCCKLYCPKFHIFTNIVIFQVFLQLFRPTASSL